MQEWLAAATGWGFDEASWERRVLVQRLGRRHRQWNPIDRRAPASHEGQLQLWFIYISSPALPLWLPAVGIKKKNGLTHKLTHDLLTKTQHIATTNDIKIFFHTAIFHRSWSSSCEQKPNKSRLLTANMLWNDGSQHGSTPWKRVNWQERLWGKCDRVEGSGRQCEQKDRKVAH